MASLAGKKWILLVVALLLVVAAVVVIVVVLTLRNGHTKMKDTNDTPPENAVFFCKETGLWIVKNQTCNNFADCPTSRDEYNCECNVTFQYACLDGPCVYKSWTCDGVADCPLGDDENSTNCKECKLGEKKCAKDNTCVRQEFWCDGKVDCPTGSTDELDCVKINGSGVTSQSTVVNVTHAGVTGRLVCHDSWRDDMGDRLCEMAGFSNMISSYWFSVESASADLFLAFNANSSKDFNLTDAYMVSCPSSKALTLKCQVKDCGTRRVPNTTQSVGQYILAGQWAKAGAWPWHAVLLSRELCGGSLIDPLWVLTAAHCVYAKFELYNFTGPIGVEDLEVYFGMTTLFDLNAEEKKRLVKGEVKAIYIHPGYNATTAQNDVALVRLYSPVGYDGGPSREYVGQVCLPRADIGNAPEFKVCVSTGFGYTEENKISSVLRQTRLNVLPDDFCSLRLANHEWIDHRTCIGTRPAAGHNNICSGDSGGPFVCSDARGVWTLVGVHSYVVGAGAQAVKKCQLSYVQRVSYYLPWLRQTMQQH